MSTTLTDSLPLNVDDASFDRAVVQASSTKPVLVDFWAAWCGPCKAIAPSLNELARDHGDELRIAKVDVDANQALAAKYEVRAIPTLLVFVNGQPVERIVGLQSKEALLTKVRASAQR